MKKKIVKAKAKSKAPARKVRQQKNWNLLEPGDTNTFLLIVISAMFLIVGVLFAQKMMLG